MRQSPPGARRRAWRPAAVAAVVQSAMMSYEYFCSEGVMSLFVRAISWLLPRASMVAQAEVVAVKSVQLWLTLADVYVVPHIRHALTPLYITQ